MTKRGVVRVILASIVSFGATSAATFAGDLSTYRKFQFGMDLPTVAKHAGETREQAKVIHRRPVLIQELSWRPHALSPSQPETAMDVVFRFYDGKLFQIVVRYDRYGTQGLTAEDITKAVSAMYGLAAERPALAKPTMGPYGDPEESVAVWQDSQHRFDLIRSSYGPSFRLVGVLKGLEVLAREAVVEANRLDVIEAPQQEAARIASEEEARRVNLEKARFENLTNFRP